MDTHESRIRGRAGHNIQLTDKERHQPGHTTPPPHLPDTPLIRHRRHWKNG